MGSGDCDVVVWDLFSMCLGGTEGLGEDTGPCGQDPRESLRVRVTASRCLSDPEAGRWLEPVSGLEECGGLESHWWMGISQDPWKEPPSPPREQREPGLVQQQPDPLSVSPEHSWKIPEDATFISRPRLH